MNVFHRCSTYVVLFTILFTPVHLPACCPVFRDGSPVQIADQKVLLIWDSVTKTEHFIREATFSADQDSHENGFGFLVPSPSVPDIAAADGSIFDILTQQIQPRIEDAIRWQTYYSAITRYFLGHFLLSADRISRSVPPTDSVQVIKTVHIGQYEATVLKASDPTELTTWLHDNEYDSRPELTEWSRPYVEKGWMITAFKYSEVAQDIELTAVRLSFKTESPVFPYRVPVDQIEEDKKSQSLLRAFVIGPGRATGSFDNKQSNAPWLQGVVQYAKPLTDSQGLLENVLRGNHNADWEMIQGLWLTAFDDHTWPSGTKDLLFSFNPNGDEFQRVEKHYQDRERLIPIDVVVLTGITCIIIYRRRRSTSP